MASPPSDTTSSDSTPRTSDLKLVEQGAETPAPGADDLTADASTGGEGARAGGSPERPPDPGAGEDPGDGQEERRRRGVPLWVLILLLALAALFLGWQVDQIGTLEQEVARLEGELSRTTARLQAHRVRLGEIRGGIHDLANRVEGLRALVDAEPDGAFGPADAADSSESAGAREQDGSREADGRRVLPARLPQP